MKKTSIAILTMILSLALSGGTSLSAEETYTMRIGYATINDSQDYGARLFKEKVEAATNGRVKIELYPGSQLGTNQKVVDSVQTGTVEGTFQPTAFLGGFVPVLTTGDLPYLWPDQHVMLDILNNTEIGHQFARVVESKGVVIVGFVNQGAKHMVTNTEIKDISGIKGKKFRVMGAPVLVDMMRIWGGSAVPMAMSEIYTALQQKTVDGIEQTMELTQIFNYFEAAPYILLTSHGLLPEGIMVNAAWYNNLPEDIRSIMNEIGHSVYKESSLYCDKANQEALDKMKAHPRVQVLTPSDEVLRGFKDASAAVYEKFMADNPEARVFVEGFQAEVAKRTAK
jgi:C4-dicarboxylate-binding protein DctP